MLIDVRTDDRVKGSAQSSDQVKAAVHAALDRFGDRVRRVDVHLSDAISNKTGLDHKCCMIQARCDGREPIVVTHQEATMEKAIHDAVRGLKNSLESVFGKEASLRNRRDHQ